MKKKLDKSRRKPNKRTVKAARNTLIVAEAIQGKSNQALATKFDLSYQEVSKILNGPEARAYTKRCENKLILVCDDATDKLIEMIQHKDARIALEACKMILKSTGVLKEKSELTLNLPRPTIIRKLNGDTIILGSREGDDENGKD